MTGSGGWPMSRLPDPGRPPVLRRHLLPRRAAPRDAVVPPGARGRRPGLAGAARPRSRRPARGWSRAWSSSSTLRGGVAGRRGPSSALLDAATAGDRGVVRCRQRRLGRRAQVPAADDDRVPAPPARRDRRRADARRSRCGRSRRWPTAGSTTSSAAASTATRRTRDWLVPHFEQMLYDNAQLARVYLHAWALHGRASDGATSRPGTLDYMIRELTTVDGAFAASQDADTEGSRGPDVHVARDRDPRGPGRRRAVLRDGLRRHRRGQLGGRHDPVPGPRRCGAGRRLRSDRGRGRRRDSERPERRCSLAGPSAPSRPATTRRSRPGTGWRSRRSRRRAACVRASRAYVAAATRAAESDRRRTARGGRRPRSVVEGRPCERQRRPRGLRGPGRRPARPVRGDVR